MTKITGIEEHTRKLLIELGVDLENENFKDTPKRVARMYTEIVYPKKFRDNLIKEILSKTFPSKYSGMIISSGIRTYSLCGHHFLPIVLDVVIGYIPSEKVLGLSKLARLADIVAKQPLIQEDYTEEIADKMEGILRPQGVGVYVSGLHYCQTMRGIKQRNAIMTTTSLRGIFMDATVKQEFMDKVYANKEE